ncbi:MAG TPA: hypothetical protein GX742_03690 [Acholeplasmataceae bacterium]|nr:hypothetical protein [Acholeplasmataceae bacterium]
MKKKHLLIMIILFSIALAACSKKEEPKFTFNDKSITLEIGDEFRLEYELTKGFKVEFDLDNNDVITLEDGVVKALNSGSVTITGTVEGYDVQDTIEIIISEGETELYVSGTKTFYAEDLVNIATKMDNLEFKDNKLVLVNKDISATYESTPIEFNEFEELVLTWNATTNDGTATTFRLAIGDGNNFSIDFIMGYYQNNNLRSIGSQSDNFASVSIDTLINKDTTNNKYVIIKFVVIASENNVTEIKNISVTSKQVNTSIVIDYSLLFDKTIAVPPKQQLAIPAIGNLICSPTSLSMVIDYYGYETDVVTVANAVSDKGARGIFGNWTLNASYAGSFDNITSRVEYINEFSQLVDYIKNDIPVILSIRTTSKEQLEGTIMAYASGHLLVLSGFKERDGKWYAVVNDPAEHVDENVIREYPIEQLMNVWRNYTYILSDAIL